MATVGIIRPPRSSTRLELIPGETFSFDAVISEQIDDGLQLSDHEVEDGADITDHARRELTTLSMKVKFTALPHRGDATPNRHVLAYRALLEILATKEPVTVVTPLRVLPSMTLHKMSSARSSSLGEAVEPSLEFRETRFAAQTLVDVPPEILKPRAKKSGTSKVDAGAEPATDLSDPNTFIGPPAPEAATAEKKTSRLKGGAGILG